MLLTRPPLRIFESKLSPIPVRLACIRHAASVRPEPGSNSPIKVRGADFVLVPTIVCCQLLLTLTLDTILFSFQRTFVFFRRSDKI